MKLNSFNHLSFILADHTLHIYGLSLSQSLWSCCLYYYRKHICTCASVYSNFTIIYIQLCIKCVL